MSEEGERRERDDVISLRDYFEDKFRNSERAISAAHASMDRRLESMNEFRNTLRDQAGKFVTRTEHDALAIDIGDLREFKATLQGMATQKSVYIAYLLSLLSIGLGLVGLTVHMLR